MRKLEQTSIFNIRGTLTTLKKEKKQKQTTGWISKQKTHQQALYRRVRATRHSDRLYFWWAGRSAVGKPASRPRGGSIPPKYCQIACELRELPPTYVGYAPLHPVPFFVNMKIGGQVFSKWRTRSLKPIEKSRIGHLFLKNKKKYTKRKKTREKNKSENKR